jgi:hypothetical protein
MTRSTTPVTKLAFTVREFCESCSVGRSTFYLARKANQIQTVKVGKRTLIAVAEAERWLGSLPKA